MAMRDKSCWFAAKSYGIGWSMPVTWQGWVTVLVYLVVLLAGLRMLSGSSERAVFIVGLTALLVVVVAWKGEKPVRWRWGRR